MVLKRERPETDDVVIKKSGCKGKILGRNFNVSRNINEVLADPYKKNSKLSLNIFCILEHSNH